jgi:diguanylate cyclase (GGDEF)-like protein
MNPFNGNAASAPGAVATVPLVQAGEASPAMHALGRRLTDSAERVLALTTARAGEAGRLAEPALQERVEEISRTSTIAVACWLEGRGLEAARREGERTWRIFGELAARRDASLDDITLLCIFWRDAMHTILGDLAHTIDGALDELDVAHRVLQMSLDFSLVQMCRYFEEQLKGREAELAFLATHDALTGLPNRALILDRITQMLARRRSGDQLAALFIDLDGFKAINDTYGHEAGDELLKSVAARLDSATRGEDSVGRLGGDEFVVISDHLSIANGPDLIAERVLDALRPPFDLGEDLPPIAITASIGVAVGARDTAGELLRDADIAMYAAKSDGKARWKLFESGMEERLYDRTELEQDLRGAIDNQQFFLAYQPTFSLADMRPSGVEALIRWDHPTRGIVAPNDFIPLLEETGLICEVGRWVLGTACAQGAAWHAAGHEIGIAVNVSARQLDSDEVVGDIEAALSESGLEPTALTIEITETAIMRNLHETARRLTAVRELGVRIAIDDFGTGYSSLAHVKQFPVDALKIDRSFISGLSQHRESDAFIRTLVDLGKALRIETFAEGIEDVEQLELLQGEQCEGGQGFLFSRPLDVAGVEAFLHQTAAGDRPGQPERAQEVR